MNDALCLCRIGSWKGVSDSLLMCSKQYIKEANRAQISASELMQHE